MEAIYSQDSLVDSEGVNGPFTLSLLPVHQYAHSLLPPSDWRQPRLGFMGIHPQSLCHEKNLCQKKPSRNQALIKMADRPLRRYINAASYS